MKKHLLPFAMLLLLWTQTKAQKPVASFSSSDTIICNEDCISFTDLSANNPTSWQWSFQGAYSSSSTDQNPQNICYFNWSNRDTAYNVTLITTNANGRDTLTQTGFITVKPSPPTPVIYQSYDTLFCSTDSSYISYQWYSDTMLIPGATSNYYVMDSCSNYNVLVTGSNGCEIAVGVNIIVPCGGAGIEDYVSGNLISLYPNPATNQLTIHASSLHSDKPASVFIMDVLGREVLQSSILHLPSSINISSLPAGIYFLQLKWDGGSVVKKFVKE